MVNGGQFLAGELGIGRRFKPAHTAHRQVTVTFAKSAEIPTSGTRPACGIDEPGHRLLPAKFAVSVQEWLPPVLSLPIATGVDELLILGVSDLTAVEPKVIERVRLLGAAHANDVNHSRRMRILASQFYRPERHWPRRQFNILIPFLGNAEAQKSKG